MVVLPERPSASVIATGSEVELAVDDGIEILLPPDDALEDAGEMLLVGAGDGAVVRVLADAVGLELVDHLGEIGAGHVHLVERLHGGKPRPAPRQGAAAWDVRSGVVGAAHAWVLTFRI